MPDKMTIRINVIPTSDPNDDPTAMQTVSKFSIAPKGHVTFTNDATASATVVFESPSPLCQGNTPIPDFPLGAGGSVTHQVCQNAEGSEFKYTATVTGAAEEDPILIVERSVSDPGLNKKPIFFPEGIPMMLVGALIGALIGYLIARRLLVRNPRQP